MKCPKCGFNSFEYLSSCKKCGNALDAFKDSLGLRPLVLAPDLSVTVPGIQPSSDKTPDQAPSGSNTADETFQWDPPVVQPTSNPADPIYEEFDLNLGDTVPAPASSTLSFEVDPPALQEPAQALPSDNALFGELSFKEPSEELTDPFSQDAYEQSPQTAAGETPFGELSFDDSLQSDPFTSDLTDTDNPFGETAETVFETASNAEHPFDPFGEITQAELQQKSVPMTSAVGDLEPGDFLMTDETTAMIQEAEKASTTPERLDNDELESLFGELETLDKKKLQS